MVAKETVERGVGAPECEKIAREVAEEILRENPGKAFRRYLEDVGVM